MLFRLLFLGLAVDAVFWEESSTVSLVGVSTVSVVADDLTGDVGADFGSAGVTLLEAERKRPPKGISGSCEKTTSVSPVDVAALSSAISKFETAGLDTGSCSPDLPAAAFLRADLRRALLDFLLLRGLGLPEWSSGGEDGISVSMLISTSWVVVK